VSHFLLHTGGGHLVASALVGVLVFLAAIFALRARGVGRLRKRLEPHVPAEEAITRRPVDRLQHKLAGLFAATDRLFGGSRLWRKLAAALERADSSMRPAELFHVMAAAGFVLMLFLAAGGFPFVLALLASPIGALLPYVLVARKGGKRQKAFDEQLPDLLMTMAASVRVGHTFRQSMQAVVAEGQEPASKEFQRALVETDFGRPIDRALAEMAQRLGSRNFDYVINVVTIQREVGGSLATLFDMVSDTVRQRQQFTKKVRALTAMGRMSAYILSALPFAGLALLSAINPHYAAPLFTTSTGRILVVAALCGMVIGGIILKKIVSFRLA
jgi:tight adherence protein B